MAQRHTVVPAISVGILACGLVAVVLMSQKYRELVDIENQVTASIDSIKNNKPDNYESDSEYLQYKVQLDENAQKIETLRSWSTPVLFLTFIVPVVMDGIAFIIPDKG